METRKRSHCYGPPAPLSEVALTIFDEEEEEEESEKNDRPLKKTKYLQRKTSHMSATTYHKYSKKHQQKLKNDICDELGNVFTAHGVHHKKDILNIIKSFETNHVGANNDIGDPRALHPAELEKAFEKQLTTLSLKERYALIRRLTHITNNNTDDDDADDATMLNEDMLMIFPFLRTRSEHILNVDRVGRKIRNDKLNLEFISDFMHDHCRINTFERKIEVGTDESGDRIFHPIHEYTDTLENIYRRDFCESKEYKEFRERNDNREIGFTKFFLAATKCPCIRTPSLRSCVDEVEVNLSESIATLKSLHRANQDCACNFCGKMREKKAKKRGGELSALSSTFTFLDHIIPCSKVKYPCDVGMVRSSIFKKKCCFGECQECANFEQSLECIFQCPTLFNPNRVYVWKEFEDHVLENDASIRELRIKEGRGDVFLFKFKAKLKKYKVHYFIYKWLDLCRRCDVLSLSKFVLYIQTDYSAQVIFESQDKLNSQGHGVCVLSCWVVLHSPEVISYQDADGEVRHFTFYECDHIRFVSPATGKGKDQDWYLHCKIFDFLIAKYKAIIPDLHRAIVWTDGAVTQYKCRQNFFNIAQFYRKHNIKLVHRFAATAQFKGIHDKVGQAVKWAVGYFFFLTVL